MNIHQLNVIIKDNDRDLSGMDLSGMDLSGAKLDNLNLAYANLHLANLSGATVHGTNLTGAVLSHINILNTSGDGVRIKNICGFGSYVVYTKDILQVGLSQHEIMEWADMVDDNHAGLDRGGCMFWIEFGSEILQIIQDDPAI